MLAARAPRVRVIDALHDVPDFRVEPAAHLLLALHEQYPQGSVFLAVVDPGVGTARDAIVVKADGRSFVGPDNGLLSLVWQRARRRECARITWRPERLTSSFHGRDLFAPVAAALAIGHVPRGWLASKERPSVLLADQELSQVIYIDHYGNAATGLRPSGRNRIVRVGRRNLAYARTFDEAKGPFWHENSMGLVEVAVPRGSAARKLRLEIGTPVAWGDAKRRRPRGSR